MTKQEYVPEDFNVEQRYRYCFGIIAPNADKPSDIMLSFNPRQGKYIKTLPLHHTQQIIADNENELKIELKLYLTYDLLMELLSFGDSVRVMKPEALARQVKQAHETAFRQYWPSFLTA